MQYSLVSTVAAAGRTSPGATVPGENKKAFSSGRLPDQVHWVARLLQHHHALNTRRFAL
ncbi:MAG: hypothetical protein ABIS36_12010 [Chryseolinea sp.]